MSWERVYDQRMAQGHEEAAAADAPPGLPASPPPPPAPGPNFTPDQQQRLQDWFRNKWNHGPCPVCAANSYAPPDRPWEVRPFHGGNMVIGGPGGIIPMFPVSCTNCGYIVWINALISGVVLPRPPEQQGQ
jgi:hypothetical protein